MSRKLPIPPLRHFLPLTIVSTILLYTLFLNHELRIELIKTRAEVNKDLLTFVGAETRRHEGDKSCTIVGCYTPEVNFEPYWRYYVSTGYSVAITKFTGVLYKMHTADNKWCDVIAVREELRRDPHTRILYVDMDTKVNTTRWCNLPEQPTAPIIMNSLFRGGHRGENYGAFKVHGTQVQSNAFITSRGLAGLEGMQRWEHREYNAGAHVEQGSVHLLEHWSGVCGVPGWIACHTNPYGNDCHCGRAATNPDCIESLFNGTRTRCPIP